MVFGTPSALNSLFLKYSWSARNPLSRFPPSNPGSPNAALNSYPKSGVIGVAISDPRDCDQPFEVECPQPRGSRVTGVVDVARDLAGQPVVVAKDGVLFFDLHHPFRPGIGEAVAPAIVGGEAVVQLLRCREIGRASCR